MGFCQLPYPMMLFCFPNVARLFSVASWQPPKLDMLAWSCWIFCWDLLPPPPKSKQITHQQKGSLCISFQFQGSLQLGRSLFPRMLPWRSGVGWDYWSSKNTTLLVVTRQHPGGGGVHIPYTLQGNEKTYPTFGKRKSSTWKWQLGIWYVSS